MHLPVLADEAVSWLRVKPEGVYVDCTAGAGGHAARVAAELTTGQLIALDRDPKAVRMARERLAAYPQAVVLQRNHGEVRAVLTELGISTIDGLLLDAGVSSMQLDDPARGFSFQESGPLDMRMDPSQGESASDYLKSISETELANVLRSYGDVGPAKRIASVIVQRARAGQLTTTADLQEAICQALPFVRGVPKEVRTAFQAIRIAVNREFEAITEALRAGINLLRPGGRIVAIAFHSGEDRIIKNLFRDASRPQHEFEPDGRVRRTHPPVLRVLTPTPVTPSEAECEQNPRAQSARLRAAERLPTEKDAAQ